MIPTEADIKAAYKVANDEKKEYIDSDELYNSFYAIKEKYHLHVDVSGNLAYLIDAIILEIVPLAQFPQLLKEVLANSPESDYQAILKAVNDEVFTVFRTQVKERAEAARQKKEKEDKEDKEYEDMKRKEFEAKYKAAHPDKDAQAAGTQAPVVPPPALEQKVAPSVIEQKVTAPSAPEGQKIVVPPPTPAPPQTPPKYHGADPYREKAE